MKEFKELMNKTNDTITVGDSLKISALVIAAWAMICGVAYGIFALVEKVKERKEMEKKILE